MGLEKHRGKWTVRLPDRRRVTTGIDATPENRAIAEQKKDEILKAIARQLKSDTLDDIMTAYIEDMPSRAKPVIRQDTAAYARKALKSFWGAYKIPDITYDRCRQYISAARRAGNSDSTIRQRLKYLRAAVNWHDPHNEARFDYPAPSEPRSGFLTRDNFKALIRASRGRPHVRVFMRLALATCARQEALFQLRWDTHIDFDRELIWLGFKAGGKKRATVKMTRGLYRVLLIARRHAFSAYVIEFKGKPIKSIRRALLSVYERAGVDPQGNPAHIFRHTAGVWMAQDGVSMNEIKARMGHSSITVTETHYARFHPEYMDRSNRALGV